MAHHFVDGSEAKLCHNGSQLVRDVVKEVNNMFRSTLELGTELRVLSSNADRAGVH